MRYAVISDIHGNSAALKTVLDDASTQNIDAYLFAGDYINDQPFINETLGLIRGVKNAHIIRGNRDEYYFDLTEDELNSMQMAAMRVVRDTITPSNNLWLHSLPSELTIEASDRMQSILLTHFTWGLKDFKITSQNIKREFEGKTPTRADINAYAKSAIISHHDTVAKFASYPHDVIIYGHNHVQHHLRLHDKLIVNPGSAGQPCDCDSRAPYTILDYSAGKWHVEERRVTYDVDATIKRIRSSNSYHAAHIWYELNIMFLRTGRDYVTDIFAIADRISAERSDPRRPYSDEVWELAYKELQGLLHTL